jgi:DNA polymerase-3 subunit gamma/tau
MSYLVLARKWRPQGFDDLIGQQPIVKILTNSINQGKTAHAYVFSGPRGVGKTSTARILAKSLNCRKGPTPSPCGECESCRAITDGYSVDVIEIDGASNNSVDDIRDLREKVKYAPSGGQYKIYIIDESHMLSTSAFNALLKTLEEPPPHVVFVLATTEPRKIPLTVMSRCQHLPFRRVSTGGIKERLRHIASSENIKVSEPALGMIARAADGSIRDSLTVLDQVSSFSAEIEESDVRGLLDISDIRSLLEMADAVVGGDRERILTIVSELVETGADLRAFTKDLIKLFRNLLVTKLLSGKGDFLDAGEEELDLLMKTSERVSDEHIVLILNEMLKAESSVRTSFSPRVALEMSLIRISYLSTFKEVKKAISFLSKTGDSPPAEPPGLEDALVKDEQTSYEKPREIQEEIIEDSEIKEPYEEGPDEAPLSADSLLRSIADNMEDIRLSSMLTKASPALEGDTLNLTFNSSEAGICAKPVKESSELIEKLASDLRKAPTRIEIHIKKSSKSHDKPGLRERVLSEPVIKEALDLFEGRVLNYNVVEEKENPKNGG